MTYTDLKNMFLDGSQNTGSTDTNLLSFFTRQLDTKYQLILAELSDYQTQVQRTASTVAAQQFYHYPPGMMQIETATVTVGTISYPVTVINSQYHWDLINELLISTTSIPQYVFPRRDDFGIWPIPQAVYTLTLNYNIRDRKLSNDDYTTGTVTATNGNQTMTGSGTTWTVGMSARWFKVNTDNYWYRISSVPSSTSITLENAYEGTSGASLAYTIGEAPELPDEAHYLLATGVIGDFYALLRGDPDKGARFNNIFWTGDAQNSDRTGANVLGGLIGLKKRYADRSNSVLVRHMKPQSLSTDKIWGQKIT